MAPYNNIEIIDILEGMKKKVIIYNRKPKYIRVYYRRNKG